MKVNGKDSPIYYGNLWKIKNLWNHQPASIGQLWLITGFGFGVPDFQTPKNHRQIVDVVTSLPSKRRGSTFLQASKVTRDSWWFMPFWAVESGKQHHVLICFLVYPDCEPFRSNLERLSKTQDMAQQLGTNGPTQFLLFYYSTMPKLGSNLKLYSIWWYSTSTWELYGNYMGIIWELYGNSTWNIFPFPCPNGQFHPRNAISAASRRRQQSSRSLRQKWLTPEDVLFFGSYGKMYPPVMSK